MKKIPKPIYTEYAIYYEQFINLVMQDKSVLLQLKENAKKLTTSLLGLSELQLTTPYAPTKWTLKEVLQHLMDVERIVMYRALCFSRNDVAPKPFFDENKYIQNSIANTVPIKKLCKEYALQRQSTIVFFENQNTATLKRIGIASNSAMSVRACAYILCGHEMHHTTIIKQRYLMQ